MRHRWRDLPETTLAWKRTSASATWNFALLWPFQLHTVTGSGAAWVSTELEANRAGAGGDGIRPGQLRVWLRVLHPGHRCEAPRSCDFEHCAWTSTTSSCFEHSCLDLCDIKILLQELGLRPLRDLLSICLDYYFIAVTLQLLGLRALRWVDFEHYKIPCCGRRSIWRWLKKRWRCAREMLLGWWSCVMAGLHTEGPSDLWEDQEQKEEVPKTRIGLPIDRQSMDGHTGDRPSDAGAASRRAVPHRVLGAEIGKGASSRCRDQSWGAVRQDAATSRYEHGILVP